MGTAILEESIEEELLPSGASAFWQWRFQPGRSRRSPELLWGWGAWETAEIHQAPERVERRRLLPSAGIRGKPSGRESRREGFFTPVLGGKIRKGLAQNPSSAATRLCHPGQGAALLWASVAHL